MGDPTIPMRAISLWQPWASAVAVGIKGMETRGWSTNYRGPLAIHAAKKDTVDNQNFFDCSLTQPWSDYRWAEAGYSRWGDLPFGAIVATATLGHVVRSEAILSAGPEADWGDYRPGRFVWILRDIVRLEQPIPWKGSQGFFTVEVPLVPEVRHA